MRGLRSPVLGERMQAPMGATRECIAGPIHSVAYVLIPTYSYLFLQVTSSAIITFTYPFTTNDNHLNKSTIPTSVICCFSGHQESWHHPKFDWLCPKFDREVIWNFCVIRLLLYQASAHNAFYIIWRAILHRLSKCYSIYSKGQSWHLTDDPSPI